VSSSLLPTQFLAEVPPARAPREWPRFMTARVAADYCDSSPWTIRRHVQPCGRRGRCFVYAIEAVESWMRGSAVSDRQPIVVALTGRKAGAPAGESIAKIRHMGRSRAEDSAANLGGGGDDMAA
jgi:hypothetical protein